MTESVVDTQQYTQHSTKLRREGGRKCLKFEYACARSGLVKETDRHIVTYVLIVYIYIS